LQSEPARLKSREANLDPAWIKKSTIAAKKAVGGKGAAKKLGAKRTRRKA